MSATCATCGRELTAAEYSYCKEHRAELWARAPLPEGHPAGQVGADLERPKIGQLSLLGESA